MHIINSWLAAAGATVAFAAASIAQTWDLPGITQRLSGQEYDITGSAALVVANDRFHYLDWDLSTIPPALDLGSAKQLYRYPVSWHKGATRTYFEAGGSPTGSSVKVTLSVDAVVYEVTGVNYQGLVVWTSPSPVDGVSLSALARLELFGADVAQAAVHPLPVVERLNVLEDRRPGLLPGGERLLSHQLLLQRRPEALLRGVVVAVV